MRVLHWKFTYRYDRFLEKYKPILKNVEIIYRYTEEHYIPEHRNKKGILTIDNGKFVVYLNKENSSSLAEETAAHEISHGLLVIEGYGFAVVKVQDPDRVWEPVATALSSAVSDVLIDARLKEFGFTGSSFYKNLYSDTLAALKKAIASDKLPTVAENALGFFRCYYSLHTRQFESLEGLWRKKDPLTAHVGSRLINISKILGFDTPEKFNRLLIEFRSILQLEPYIRIVTNRGAIVD